MVLLPKHLLGTIPGKGILEDVLWQTAPVFL